MNYPTQTDLHDRLQLIESMIQEGRSSSGYWGWTFLLWGVAYLIAIAWTYFLPYPQYSWPVTMTATALLFAAMIRWKHTKRPRPESSRSRALAGIWFAVGTAIFLFAFAGAASGHFEFHMYLAGIEILIGTAHASSAFTLRWRPQFLIALVWWISGVASYYVAVAYLLPIMIVATLIGNIAFGIYLMRLESAGRQTRVVHV